ncbi:MAG: alpha/beta hydrolase [Rhodospirillaceae bacterium]|jgi:pimeloyl-ACP methyl ester carboxylesterase|nr:alpha/beta hydrolase [Rhodospirillaceae bacterium]MBT5245299.1 alpha/beta hydrolase [Rhodospirillaceae bacterium]MBT5563033.1 alpha/beta hydrolase [Rhodospirillaceae bacterium]MBT6241065.1 alpha/beta hydrolase [Rhodospirillaceae bacterium]MBT7138605.1 alpha/beta hydrolase [Rhodospirillaceae bacterium]
MRVIVILCALITYYVHPVTAFALEAKLVKVESKRGVKQPFLFVRPDNPKAGVVLFIGGDGSLYLSSSGKIVNNDNNFLSRTFRKFAGHGLMVALVDVPSDKERNSAMFRIGQKHALDIAAVIDYMKKQSNVPIWMVGTSMGSFSAASVAIKKKNKVSGLVLTSSVTQPKHEKALDKLTAKYPDGVAGLSLQKIKIPVLIVYHTKDTCKVTPPGDAGKLKGKLSNASRVEVVLLKGGNARKSDPCDGLSQHGYYGLESEAVKKIATFITQ